MSNALDDLLEELPWDYDEIDTANRLLDYRERAAAELAKLHAQHAAAAKESSAALDEARWIMEAAKRGESVKRVSAAWLDKYPPAPAE